MELNSTNNLTIIIPVYRRIKDCVDYLNDLRKNKFESYKQVDFILSLNAVVDLDPTNILFSDKNVKYFTHDCTLSIGENWVSCIEKLNTPYFKINSSNDPINIFEIAEVMNTENDFDLIIGKTEFHNLGEVWPLKVNNFRSNLMSFDDSEYFFNNIIFRNNLGDISGYIFKSELISNLLKSRRSFHLNSVHNYPDYSIILYGFIKSKKIVFYDLNLGHYVADPEAPVMAVGIKKELYYKEYDIFRLTNYLFNKWSEERQLFRLSIFRFVKVVFKLIKNSF